MTELHSVDEVLSVIQGDGNAVLDPELEQVIEDMVGRVDSEVPEAVKQELKKLMHAFPSAFAKNDADMGLADLVIHRIDTGADATSTEAADEICDRFYQPVTPRNVE